MLETKCLLRLFFEYIFFYSSRNIPFLVQQVSGMPLKRPRIVTPGENITALKLPRPQVLRRCMSWTESKGGFHGFCRAQTVRSMDLQEKQRHEQICIREQQKELDKTNKLRPGNSSHDRRLKRRVSMPLLKAAWDVSGIRRDSMLRSDLPQRRNANIHIFAARFTGSS